MEKKRYIVAVDLGSSQVVVAVAERRADAAAAPVGDAAGQSRSGVPGGVHVLCVVSKPVEGMRAGKIENIELVSRAVHDAVEEAEQQLGIRITEAYASISGDFVRCARHTDHVFVYDHQNGVERRDVEALFDRMRNVQAPDDETIMERVPQNYVVDDNQEVKNPVGSFGKKLSSTFNFILCAKTPMQRLEMALKRVGITMLSVYATPLSAPESVLTPDEREEGVAVVDLGSGVTDVAVYFRNVMRYTASIPMGASAINQDIRTMSVPEKYVESLKQKYGSAVAELAPDDRAIRVAGRTSRESKDILLRNLATVIEARAMDIAEFVHQEIKDSGYDDKLAYGIVLTGGGAKLAHIDELFRRVTNMDVRVAKPETGFTEESLALLADPAYATVAGVLLKGALAGSCAVVERPLPVPPAAEEPDVQTPPAMQPPHPAAPAAPAAEEPAPRDEAPRSEPRQPAAPHTEARPSADTFPGAPEGGNKRQGGRRNLGSLLQGAISRINDAFSGGEDEEI